MTFKQLESKIDKSVERIVKETAFKFNADIKIAWAVDTGYSKGRWDTQRVNTLEWTVTNDAQYSPILWMGRVGNRGSYQLPNGGDPILEANKIEMKQKLKKVL